MFSVIISLNRPSLRAAWESRVRNSGRGKIARLPVIVVALAASLALSPFAAHAWSNDPTASSSVCTTSSTQQDPHLVSDGAGGVIITWTDFRTGSDNDIYAQRIDSSGAPLWTVNGVPICAVGNHQADPRLVSDGAGGAIITWTDNRAGYNVYAQRVNSSGVVQWTAGGVGVCTAVDDQGNPEIVSDGAGGAIITWADFRSGTDYDIYAQRMDSSGAPQWTTDGVAICTAANNQYAVKLISDGAGGAIITWGDSRGTDEDLYAQRVSSSGAPQWTADGDAVCTATGTQDSHQLIGDGAGGVIITWRDGRGSNKDIYAQRLNSSGAAQWSANGISVCTASRDQNEPQLISTGGGAIITWSDNRPVFSYDVYAQRIDSSGVAQWTADGEAVTTAAGDQAKPQLISDTAGGAIIIWAEGDQSGGDDVYAQRMNSSGAPQWTTNGVAVSTAANAQLSAQLVNPGTEGAIITWSDKRSDSGDIYASRIHSDGALVPVTVSAFNLE